MPLERKLSVLGISLAALLSFGTEGSSAKGCKNDNDCKGDRYCDENTGQCVSEETPKPSETDTVQPAQLKTILDEEFDGSSLNYKWSNANCSRTECPVWNNNCKGSCPAEKGTGYVVENGVLKVKGALAYGEALALEQGIRLEYKMRDSNSEGISNAANGLKMGEPIFIGCYTNSSSFIGCGITGNGVLNADNSKKFPSDPSQWHVIGIEADTKQVKFTVDDQSQTSSVDSSSIGLSSSSELNLFLGEGGEYDYIKIQTKN